MTHLKSEKILKSNLNNNSMLGMQKNLAVAVWLYPHSHTHVKLLGSQEGSHIELLFYDSRCVSFSAHCPPLSHAMLQF